MHDGDWYRHCGRETLEMFHILNSVNKFNFIFTVLFPLYFFHHLGMLSCLIGHFSHFSNCTYSKRNSCCMPKCEEWKNRSKCHNEKMELPFIVRQLLSGFIIQCKPLQGKENEWTHLQTCQWLSKCQIRPNLSCLDEWLTLGRVSLRLLSFPHKKVETPWETESARRSQSCCFIQRKTGL